MSTTTKKGLWHGCEYNLLDCPAFVQRTEDNSSDLDLLKWSGAVPPPAIGARVRITFNGFGAGVVDTYFWEHGYLGVRVKLDKDPAWHAKQCKGTAHAGHALVFGSEIVAE